MTTSWLLVPAALPALYLAYLDYTLSTRLQRSTTSRRTKSITHSLHTGSLTPDDLPKSLPAHIVASPTTYLLIRTRISSKPVPASHLPSKYRPGAGPRKRSSSLSSSASSLVDGDRASEGRLVVGYARGLAGAFSRLPTTHVMRSLLEEPRRGTLDGSVASKSKMKVGDLVCGVYRVSYRDSRRIEYLLEQPEVFKGMPALNGLVVATVEIKEGRMGGRRADGDATVVFVNETWMWRKPHEGYTLLETVLGGWIHRLATSWVVAKGVETLVSHRGFS